MIVFGLDKDFLFITIMTENKLISKIHKVFYDAVEKKIITILVQGKYIKSILGLCEFEKKSFGSNTKIGLWFQFTSG